MFRRGNAKEGMKRWNVAKLQDISVYDEGNTTDRRNFMDYVGERVTRRRLTLVNLLQVLILCANFGKVLKRLPHGLTVDSKALLYLERG